MNEYLCRRMLLGWWLMAAIVTAVACNSHSPSEPSPASAGAGTPRTIARYHASGTVTDDAGAPIAAASIEVHYTPDGPHQAVRPVRSKTTGAGRYDVWIVDMWPITWWLDGKEMSGLVYAWAQGFEPNSQYWDWGTVDRVKDIRLQRTQTFTAGEPIPLTIGPDSSICTDLDGLWLLSHRCQSFQVLADQDGTLTITANPSEVDPSSVYLYSATAGWSGRQVQGPGTLSVRQVRAGESHSIFAGMPEGTSQRITLLTSVQR